jgi:transposase
LQRPKLIASTTDADGAALSGGTIVTMHKGMNRYQNTERVIADKGYDGDSFVQTIRATEAKVVIPPRSNRRTKRRYSRTLYRTRNLVERFFNRIKNFRRVSTRYDKLADSYLVFATLTCALGPFVRM